VVSLISASAARARGDGLSADRGEQRCAERWSERAAAPSFPHRVERSGLGVGRALAAEFLHEAIVEGVGDGGSTLDDVSGFGVVEAFDRALADDDDAIARDAKAALPTTWPALISSRRLKHASACPPAEGS